jgi:inorganic pyrophosphatase
MTTRKTSRPDQAPVHAIVETPRGSRNKYKWDEQTDRIKLSKVMPQGMVFPYDFGYFPDTCSEDGDPLDVLILNDEPTFSGCQIDCRLIGVIPALQRNVGQEERRNDRVVAVAEASVIFASVRELSEVEPVVLKQIEAFFVNYQKVRDVQITLLRRQNSISARKLLQQAIARHKKH